MVDKVKEVIKAHLDAMAQKDACFAERYANHDKNIDECMDYILSEARKRGRTVYMSDQEVFGMAAHYYEEDGIKVSKLGSSVKAEATINDDPAELTDEEKLEKAYQTLCPITKYSGKTLAEVLTVDPHALVWVANKYKGNPEISEAAKLICEHALSENNE